MTRIVFLFLMLFTLSVGLNAQSTGPADTAATTEKPKRAPAFRANADQIKEAQTKLKAANLFAGEATGKYSDDTRAAIKAYQKANGLRSSGSLNRATLEKMGIALTDAQKTIPVRDSDYLKPKGTGTAADGSKPKRVIFRATPDQIKEAQAKLKAGGMYSGEQTGKLNDDTRAGIKKFQEANGIKVTGTLNRETLEKMSITLTEKQKADAAAEAKK
ncbi:MAG: peptidoglycan-binding domain-containing protein [Pyrinomonadaceae bacterium]|nr:peptidoglycan-binding domain-containing protein [Pyrinomonadaceae bacterium]